MPSFAMLRRAIAALVVASPAAFGMQTAPPAPPAQTAPTPPPAPAKRKSSPTHSGVIVSIDATAGTVVIKTKLGETIPLSADAGTRCLRNRRPAKLADFKPDEAVTAYVRKPRRSDRLAAVALYDAESERFIRGLRSRTTDGVLKQATYNGIVATLGSDEMDYAVSSRTLWMKAGKEVTPDAFKPGDPIYLIPNLKTNGTLSARAVADTRADAERAKERISRTLSGVIASMDATAKTLTLSLPSGDTRTLKLADDAEILKSKQPQTLAALHPGLRVAVSLKKSLDGGDVASKVTYGKSRGGRRRQ